MHSMTFGGSVCGFSFAIIHLKKISFKKQYILADSFDTYFWFNSNKFKRVNFNKFIGELTTSFK